MFNHPTLLPGSPSEAKPLEVFLHSTQAELVSYCIQESQKDNIEGIRRWFWCFKNLKSPPVVDLIKWSDDRDTTDRGYMAVFPLSEKDLLLYKDTIQSSRLYKNSRLDLHKQIILTAVGNGFSVSNVYADDMWMNTRYNNQVWTDGYYWAWCYPDGTTSMPGILPSLEYVKTIAQEETNEIGGIYVTIDGGVRSACRPLNISEMKHFENLLPKEIEPRPFNTDNEEPVTGFNFLETAIVDYDRAAKEYAAKFFTKETAWHSFITDELANGLKYADTPTEFPCILLRASTTNLTKGQYMVFPVFFYFKEGKND